MEDPRTEKSTKRKRVAKNRKKAWRKHSNIQDVEDFLEEQRQQLRTGGLVSEKTNESLFFEDKDAAVPARKKSVALKKKRGPIQHRVDKYLLPDPRVPPAPKAFPRKNKRPSKRLLDAQEKERQGLVGPIKQRRLDEAAKQRRAYETQRQGTKTARETGQTAFDIWGAEAAKVIKRRGIEADEHFLRETRNKPKKLPPKHQDKPSKLPAVEVVAPGASYNPSLEDHQTLINTTYEAELKKLKEEEKLARWHKFPKLSARQMEANYISEMSAGLFQEEGEAGAEVGQAGREEALPNPPTTHESRKTKKTRRKEKLLKEKEKQAKAEKLQRIRQNEVYRLRSITKELAEEKARQEEERQRRLERQREKESQPRAVGHHKLEEEPMVLKLSDELVGSLRELKPEGNLLRDRYKSFQKRNIIEARTRTRGAKAQYKEFEKKSHKEITA